VQVRQSLFPTEVFGTVENWQIAAPNQIDEIEKNLFRRKKVLTGEELRFILWVGI